jgi:hypothetical protein
MSCGHLICMRCIQSDTEIVCVHCGRANTTDMSNAKVYELSKIKIEDNLKIIFDDVCTKLGSIEDELKSIPLFFGMINAFSPFFTKLIVLPNLIVLNFHSFT